MKYFKTLVLAAVLLISVTSLFALPGLPNYFYGNIAIKTDGTLVTNTNIQVRITIYDGTTSLYSETFNPVAVDAFGAFTVNVGTGTLASGSWPAGPATANMNTKAEIDYGSGWVSLGARPTMQLVYQSTYGFSGNPSEINLNSGEIIVGDITNHAAAVNMSGDATISNTGALTLANTAVTAGTYGNGTNVAQVTVDGKGRVTGAANVAIAFPAETDPIWTAASGNYYTKTNMQTSGQAQLHFGNITNTPTTLAGYGITDAYTKAQVDAGFQPSNTNLSSIAGLLNAAGWLHNDGAGTFAYSTPTKSDLGLGNVENTALSTWAGTTNVTTLGTIGTGTWQGTPVADAYVANNLTIDGGSVTNSSVTPGTGHVTADYFVGTGSTTNAVDLATAEVSGILPEANIDASIARDAEVTAALAAYTGTTNVTTLGTIGTGTWNGTTIAIANGGTGATTANAAFNALAPSQATNAGKYLTTDGTNTSWATITNTLQGAYDGGNTITTAGGKNIVIAGTEQVVLNNDKGMYINHNNAAGAFLLKTENSNTAFANPLMVSAATGSARAANFTANNTAYTINVEQDGTGYGIQLGNIGGGSALYIDNGSTGGLAIDIQDATGGAVKYSYGATTIVTNACTIPNGVSVYMITSDNNGTNDAITMPTGVNGQFLYVIYAATVDNAVINGYTTTLGAQMTFVYAGGAWKLVSVVE